MQLPIKDKLSFPAGVAPGIKLGHPMAQGNIFSGISGAGGSIISLNSGKASTNSGAPVSKITSKIGPSTFYGGGNVVSTFPGVTYPATLTVGTWAAIVDFIGSPPGGVTGIFGATAAAGGTNFGTNNGPFELFMAVNPSQVNSALVLNVNRSYFCTASLINSTTIIFTCKDLLDGTFRTTTVNPAASNILVGDGTFYIGNRGTNSRSCNANVAAIAFSNTALSLKQVQDWSDNPWEFWYPELDLIPGKGSTSSSAFTLPAAEGTYSLSGQIQALTRGILSSAAQGTYTLSGKVQTLNRGIKTSAVQGTYTLTGKPQTTTSARSTSAVQGTYTLTGKPQTVGISKTLAAIQGVYSLIGKPQAFTTAISLAITRGLYSLLGKDQTLTASNDIIILGGNRWKEGYKQLVGDGNIKQAASHMSSLGGHARAKALTATQRSAIATKAASIRWK